VDTLQPTAEKGDHGDSVPSDLQLVNPTSFQLIRTIQNDAVLVDAAGPTALAFSEDCHVASCLTAIGLDKNSTPKIGALPHGGMLTGSGILDRTGRYLASASVSPDGSLLLVVCDLQAGTVHDLGPYSSLIPGAARILEEDMPSVWSGSRLIAINPQGGTLTTYDAAHDQTASRSGLTTAGQLQVWGAHS
jgi:hypothetical protein